MTAEIITLPDLLPRTVPSGRTLRSEPATVIILPVVKVERAPEPRRRKRRKICDGDDSC